jgi:type IV pilus assembly protein PilC
MLYKYKAILNTGEQRDGSIEAVNIDTAISSLQAKGLIISSIKPAVDNGNSFNIEISFFNKVFTKDVVILSRQLATLFDAQVSALRIFRIMAEQTENKKLAKHLFETADDIQGGMSISQSLSKHPDVFSDFYVNMVLSGEESGKLNESFNYLADYLDRTYEVVSKAKNALVYPLFVILTFIGVMVLMLTVIIPKIALIIKDSGQEVPIYTKATPPANIANNKIRPLLRSVSDRNRTAFVYIGTS